MNSPRDPQPCSCLLPLVPPLLAEGTTGLGKGKSLSRPLKSERWAPRAQARIPPTSPSCIRLAVQRSPEGLPAQGCQVTPLYLLRGPFLTPPALPPRPRLAVLSPDPGLLDLRVPGPVASSCWEASSGLGSAPCATRWAHQEGCWL